MINNIKNFFRFSLLFLALAFCYNSNAQIPQFYYDTAEGLHTANLKTALHQIICNDTSNYLNYGSGAGRTWQGFYYTDRDYTNDSVLDMYSYIARYFPNPNPNFASFGQDVHIEHSVPKSWWKGTEGAPYKDLHHLFPSDGPTNNAKSNYPLGIPTGTVFFDNSRSKVGNATYTTYSGRVFEPHDEFKGDFARAYFYFVTAYENYSSVFTNQMFENNTYPILSDWAINLLLDWHRNDPISQKEIDRNEIVFSFQNNRNPFIDYPILVEHIWGNRKNIPFFANNIPNIEVINHSLNSNVILNLTTTNFFPVSKTITIKGENLIGNINLSINGTNASQFSVSETNINISDASIGEEVTISYNPTSIGTHTALFTISSTSSSPFIINLNGNCQ